MSPPWFEAPFVLGQGPIIGPMYDVSPDGQRFVAIKPCETASERPRAHVVLNWTEELRRASP